MTDEATIRSRHRKARGDVDLHDAVARSASDDELESIARCHVVRPASVGATAAACRRLAQLAERVFAELHEQRAWWTRAHVTGEVAR